jgi:hypothetical protein
MPLTLALRGVLISVFRLFIAKFVGDLRLRRHVPSAWMVLGIIKCRL